MSCPAVNNKDLEQFIPMLIDTMQNPIKVPDCVHKLAATTFVQAVEAPTLSIMVPLLVRGLRHDNTTAIKRKASLIIENMAKLVDNPLDAAPFLPQLLPGLEKVSNEVADPECRSVAARAAKELMRVANEGKTGGQGYSAGDFVGCCGFAGGGVEPVWQQQFVRFLSSMRVQRAQQQGIWHAMPAAYVSCTG
jgi:elongation factor 3